MTSTMTSLLPSVALRVEPWADPVLDRRGHDPRSLYCERFWLPMLGPSATLLARQLADGLERRPSGFDLVLGDTARALGLGANDGRRSAFQRTLRRLDQFRVVHLDTRTGVLLARRRLPALTRTQVGRLPAPLRSTHEAWHRTRAVEDADGQIVAGRSQLLEALGA